ncbi:MAG TPA: hypothetical protein PLD53_01530 [Candidatus Propionivibrio aalborgensis]|nr:hypothetical protein [Candidatus Propionivibrio aalborgensis]
MVRNRRLQRQQTKKRWGAFILLLVFCIVVGGIFGYWWLQQHTIPLNADTLCPIDGPHALTVILVDRTDRFNTVQREAVRVRLDEVQAQTRIYSGIALFSIGPTENELLRPEAYLCNPGPVSEASPLYQNIRRIEQRWHAFIQRLGQAFETAVQSGEQPASPIMESIQSAALSTFARTAPDTPKRLIIISDLLQHSSTLSLYQQLPLFADFKTTNKFRQLHAPLIGVEVEVFYLRRPTDRAIQGKALIEFWQQYIRENGGLLVRVVSIEG